MFMDTNIVQSKINFYLNLWNSEIFNISKLCTHVLFKTVLVRKNFVVLDMPKYFQSILAGIDINGCPLAQGK